MKIFRKNKYWFAGIIGLIVFFQCETPDILEEETQKQNLFVNEPEVERLIIMADPDPILEEKENMVVRLENKIENLDDLIRAYKSDSDLLENTARVHIDVTIAKLEKEKVRLKQKLKEVQNATNDNWIQTQREARNRLELLENEFLNFYTRK